MLWRPCALDLMPARLCMNHACTSCMRMAAGTCIQDDSSASRKTLRGFLEDVKSNLEQWRAKKAKRMQDYEAVMVRQAVLAPCIPG